MLSETLTAGLERYGIGPKVRALRRKKRLGLLQCESAPKRAHANFRPSY
jgi:hypothetical protein